MWYFHFSAILLCWGERADGCKPMTLYVCPNDQFRLTVTFQTDSIGYQAAHFGFGVGAIVMDDVYCNGTENTLYDCPHTSLHNCHHSEDASVFCSR